LALRGANPLLVNAFRARRLPAATEDIQAA
jgi:hypothetical protein